MDTPKREDWSNRTLEIRHASEFRDAAEPVIGLPGFPNDFEVLPVVAFC